VATQVGRSFFVETNRQLRHALQPHRHWHTVVQSPVIRCKSWLSGLKSAARARLKPRRTTTMMWRDAEMELAVPPPKHQYNVGRSVGRWGGCLYATAAAAASRCKRCSYVILSAMEAGGRRGAARLILLRGAHSLAKAAPAGVHSHKHDYDSWRMCTRKCSRTTSVSSAKCMHACLQRRVFCYISSGCTDAREFKNREVAHSQPLKTM